MRVEFQGISQILITFLSDVNIYEQDFGNLGEKLDSLDRLSVITQFENILDLDLTDVLIEPSNWVSFLTLVEALVEAKNQC